MIIGSLIDTLLSSEESLTELYSNFGMTKLLKYDTCIREVENYLLPLIGY